MKFYPGDLVWENPFLWLVLEPSKFRYRVMTVGIRGLENHLIGRIWEVYLSSAVLVEMTPGEARKRKEAERLDRRKWKKHKAPLTVRP